MKKKKQKHVLCFFTKYEFHKSNILLWKNGNTCDLENVTDNIEQQNEGISTDQ